MREPAGSLAERWVPRADAFEVHDLRIAASAAEALEAVRGLDLARLRGAAALMALRSLPTLLTERRLPAGARGPLTMDDLEPLGFGRLEEVPGRAVAYGVTGCFWRPAANVDPFRREDWDTPVAADRARAVWTFAADELPEGGCLLTTETRVVCGSPAARRRFLLYWTLVRPFSGLIRILMLRAVRRSCVRPR